MTTVGIICEYNPFHNGHAKQFRLIRENFGEDCRIVCLMSGNYVQRGEPSVFGKSVRAQAAIKCGADVVLELPLTYALSSAEGFAEGGVRILSELGVQWLCFGCETADGDILMMTAKTLLQPQTDELLKAALQTGISYAAAREQALAAAFPEGVGVIRKPNDILAVEYCKAILRQNSSMKIFPLHREGDYHAQLPESENPSATSLRDLLNSGRNLSGFVPPEALACYMDAAVHSFKAGERAVLARLKGMSEEEFSHIPYGSEGLWRRFMHACRDCSDTASVIEQTKSKRYARSRIQRMLLCAFLGLTAEDFKCKPSYVRIIAFSENGREVLREFKHRTLITVSATEKVRNSAYYDLESRCERMFFLFQTDSSS